jgi:transposase
MWTEAQREAQLRPCVRYPSDLSAAEWAAIEPLIPPARKGGRPRKTNMREAVNGLLYLLRTGCQWRYLPKDFPPRSTIYNIFRQWQRDGDWDRIHHALLVKLLEQVGREASPSAGIIDSQSVKSAGRGARSTRWVMTRARRSSGASATSSSTHRVWC